MGSCFSSYSVRGVTYIIEKDKETGEVISGMLKGRHWNESISEIHPDVLRALVKELDESEE